MRRVIATSLSALCALSASHAWAKAGVSVEGSVSGGVQLGDDARTPCGGNDSCQRVAAGFAPLSLRAGTWSLEGVNRDHDPTTLTVGINPDLSVRFDLATLRNRMSLRAGGGESGFEWELGGSWMLGPRWGTGASAPFARIGLETWFAGNSDFYHSHFEAPRLEVGYQLLRFDSLFVEVGGRGGLMLAGRHRVIDRTRDIGTSLDAGGFFTLQVPFLRLHAEAVRIFERRNEPKSPIDRGQAELCGILGHSLALCATGALDRGEVSTGAGPVELRAAYLGLSLGVGDMRIFRPDVQVSETQKSATDTFEASVSQ